MCMYVYYAYIYVHIDIWYIFNNVCVCVKYSIALGKLTSKVLVIERTWSCSRLSLSFSLNILTNWSWVWPA